MTDSEVTVGSEHVGVGLRLVGIIIDSIILGIIGYLIAAVTGGTTAGGFELTGGPAFIYFLLGFLYYILMETYMGGTLGKLALGIRVRMEDGSPCTISASLIRNILRIVDALPGIIPYLLGAIFVWTSPKKQRLGDKLAKTVVVKK
jgi:uncharacterized RDD family membrane protein YckC